MLNKLNNLKNEAKEKINHFANKPKGENTENNNSFNEENNQILKRNDSQTNGNNINVTNL